MSGRPSTFTDEIADRICAAVAASSRGLDHICASDPDFPEARTVWRWLADPERETFRQKYARAKEQQADFMVDEIIDISDNGTNDYQVVGEGEEAREVVNHDHIARSRLRVDSRKWIAARLAPRKYGDKVQQEISGEIVTEVRRTIVDPRHSDS